MYRSLLLSLQFLKEAGEVLKKDKMMLDEPNVVGWWLPPLRLDLAPLDLYVWFKREETGLDCDFILKCIVPTVVVILGPCL